MEPDEKGTSILKDVKEHLPINPEDTSFDSEIIQDINTALFILMQLEVGPKEGCKITSYDETFEQFFPDPTKWEAVKTYLYLKVRMLFDPPASSIVMEVLKNEIKEHEFRLTVEAEYTGGENQNDESS